MNIGEFFAMGGYAWYVWPAWLLTFMVLLWNVLAPRYKHQQLLKQLQTKSRREQLKKPAA